MRQDLYNVHIKLQRSMDQFPTLSWT